MEIKARVKYGSEDEPWRPNLLTAILQLVLAPISIAVWFVILLLVVLYDLLTVGSQHVVMYATPKKVQYPDGSIRTPNQKEH